MKILLFLIGIITVVLLQQYINKDYPLENKEKYILYIVSSLTFAIFVYKYTLNIMTILYAVIMGIIITIGFIDYKHKLIPNKLILLLLIAAFLNFIFNIKYFKSFFLGGLFAFILCFILYKLTGFGAGDVKLLITLGLLLGLSNTFVLFLISFLLATIIGFSLVFMKKATLKSSIPFAPFVSIGFIVLSFI